MSDNTAEKLENEVSEEQLDLEVEVIDDTPEKTEIKQGTKTLQRQYPRRRGN